VAGNPAAVSVVSEEPSAEQAQEAGGGRADWSVVSRMSSTQVVLFRVAAPVLVVEHPHRGPRTALCAYAGLLGHDQRLVCC